MKKIIIGNWKMNPSTLEEAERIFSALNRLTKNFKKTELVICLPFVYLFALSNVKCQRSNVKIGAQNIFEEDPKNGSRAFTGETSATMLKGLAVEYVILGHSERRARGETDEVVNKKIKAALKAGLTPVVCVGENERDSDGKFFEILKNQIKNTFAGLKKNDFSRIILAYEPVWAIGKSERDNLKGADLHEAVIFVRKVLSEIVGKTAAFNARIIYGGSVSSANVADIISNSRVSGILPGRASLDPKEMKEILIILEKLK